MPTCTFTGGPLNGEVREEPQAPLYLTFPQDVSYNALVRDVAALPVETSWRDVVYERVRKLTTRDERGVVVQVFYEYVFRG